jgi:hypothetical protein
MSIGRRRLLMGVGVACVAACSDTIPKEALQLSETALQDRQMQTRRFGTTDEPRLLKASAQVLQDLGFNIEESATGLGVIVGSKDRDARETGQIVGAVFIALLFGVATPIDTEQKIRASLVTLPVENGTDTAVRITFQRLVWNSRKELSKIEGIKDAKIYQEFFDKLGQSVFLTAQEI